MNENPNVSGSQAPWYKHRWPWFLMAGPAIVIVAAFYSFYLANHHAGDLVTDDYYKDGKHINLQLERDVEALKRHIAAQVFFNDEHSAAKVFVSGEFDRNGSLNLRLMHPARQDFDRVIELKAAQTAQSGDKSEYSAIFDALPPAVHWYVRIEDKDGQWRIEKKWLPNQGGVVNMLPKDNVLVTGAAKVQSPEAVQAASSVEGAQ